MPRTLPAPQRNKRGSNHTRPPHERERLRICGLAAVRALFECDPDRVERLFFVPGLVREVGPLCRILAVAHKPYREIDETELARVAGTVLHGGIVAIARTAAFFGVERLVLADRPDQALPSDAAYRVAEGGLEHLMVYRTRVPGALVGLRPAYRILGTSLAEGSIPIGHAADRPVALILGNEETGLDPATLAACDEVVRIPGGGRVQSLNVASAAAILLYLLTCSPSR